MSKFIWWMNARWMRGMLVCYNSLSNGLACMSEIFGAWHACRRYSVHVIRPNLLLIRENNKHGISLVPNNIWLIPDPTQPTIVAGEWHVNCNELTIGEGCATARGIVCIEQPKLPFNMRIEFCFSSKAKSLTKIQATRTTKCHTTWSLVCEV